MGSTRLPITVCRVSTSEGVQDYVTCSPRRDEFERGLAPESIVGMLRRPLKAGESISPTLFVRNRAFVDFMHQVIARCGPTIPGLVEEAQRQMEGLVVVVDQRTHTPRGAVPPEDIIGAFEVRDGRLVTGSYKPNPNHMILSARGFVQLGSELQRRFLEELARRGPR